MIDRIPCPHCGGVFTLSQALEDMDARRFFILLGELPPDIIRPYLLYLKLFKPRKQVLRWQKILALTEELAPMIKAAMVTRNRIDYRIPLEQWIAAINQLATKPPETLELPLKGHGYLLCILASQAEKHAALQEDKTEQQRRNRGASGADEGLRPVVKTLYAPKPTSEKPPDGEKKKPPENWRKDIKV
jgi:recombinational DNA repair ATPase RecF